MSIVPLPAAHLLMPDPTQESGFRFIIERALSAGGFANTYLARDRHFDDQVVIKELAMPQLMARSHDGSSMVALPGRDGDLAGWLERAQREARLLNRVRHPGVVSVRATWTELGTAFVALDFIDGTELKAEPVSVPPEQLFPFANQLLDAVEAVHAAGLIHGDIKPSNIIVRPSGAPVLVDFGTARHVDQLVQRGMTTVAFTAGFAPPELVVSNRAAEVGPASDLYSWAMTMLGLFAPHPGADNDPVDATVRLKLQEFGVDGAGYGAPYIAVLRERNLPEAWVNMLMRCIELTAANRPQSVAEIRALLLAPAFNTTAVAQPTAPSTAAGLSDQPRGVTSPLASPAAAGLTAVGQPQGATAEAGAGAAAKPPRRGIELAAFAAAVLAAIGLVLWRADASGDASSGEFVAKQPAAAPPPPLPPAINGVTVSAGTFVMGSPAYETGRSNDEPQSRVTLTGNYWLATHEVTQELWTRVMGSNPSYFANCGSQCPVERVSWFDTIEFMNRLSLSEGRSACYATYNCTGTPGSGTVVGKQAPVWGRGDFECSSVDAIANCTGYRFPTEAEWEFAARANTTTATYNGELNNLGKRNAPNLGQIAWYAGNAVVDYEPQYPCADWTEREVYGVGCGPKPVGLLPANAFGLYDTMGNVWEWTSDWWGTYRPGSEVDPEGPPTGEIRVFKGGSWRDDAALSRSASRRGSKPHYRYGSLGIRLARNEP